MGWQLSPICYNQCKLVCFETILWRGQDNTIYENSTLPQRVIENHRYVEKEYRNNQFEDDRFDTVCVCWFVSSCCTKCNHATSSETTSSSMTAWLQFCTGMCAIAHALIPEWAGQISSSYNVYGSSSNLSNPKHDMFTNFQHHFPAEVRLVCKY